MAFRTEKPARNEVSGCPFSATKCNTYRENYEKRCLWLSFFSNEMQHIQRILQVLDQTHLFILDHAVDFGLLSHVPEPEDE